MCVENDFTTSKIFDRYVISVPTIPKTNMLTMLLSIKTRFKHLWVECSHVCLTQNIFFFF